MSFPEFPIDYSSNTKWNQCAIDFGTTYSGVAYAYYQSGMEVCNIIPHWNKDTNI